MSQGRRPRGIPAGGQFTTNPREESSAPPLAGPDWRDTPVTVQGRPFTMGQVHGGRLFHGSPHDLADGEVLRPGQADQNFAESDAAAVSITSGADLALHWAQDADPDRGTFYVYEVEPLGEVAAWRAMLADGGRRFRLQEGRTPAARILRRVDPEDARGYEGALHRGEHPLRRTDAQPGR